MLRVPTCEVCPVQNEPGEWREIFVHHDPLVALAHTALPDPGAVGIYPATCSCCPDATSRARAT